MSVSANRLEQLPRAIEIGMNHTGEIEPLLIRTFGVSVKDSESPIGFFGTGLKYALAILLRERHDVIIQSGVAAVPHLPVALRCAPWVIDIPIVSAYAAARRARSWRCRAHPRCRSWLQT